MRISDGVQTCALPIDPILIVHRDIRPSNIIYVQDADGERLVLIDWGCATRHNSEVLYAGSRAYAAHRLYAQGLTDGDTAQNYHANLTDDYGSLLLTAASVFFIDRKSTRLNSSH